MSLLAGFLGLGRPTAFAILAFGLKLAKVFRASLGDLLPTLPSKLDSGGIFLLCQLRTEQANGVILPSWRRKQKAQSYPIQDEPEGEVRFQHKMSLERMAC